MLITEMSGFVSLDIRGAVGWPPPPQEHKGQLSVGVVPANASETESVGPNRPCSHQGCASEVSPSPGAIGSVKIQGNRQSEATRLEKRVPKGQKPSMPARGWSPGGEVLRPRDSS